MTAAADLDVAARTLVEVGRAFAARGSVPATSGNFSLRLDERRVAITRSGTDKGALVPADILIVDLEAPPPPGASAETPLHTALYRARPAVGAVIHTHADAAAVLSLAGDDLLLSGWELLKAFSEDEARLFAEGSGAFYLHAGGKVLVVVCERGDYLRVPAGTRHWFDMGPDPEFTAVRLFTDPAGWVASFTGDPIADRFPRFP
jgi:hypothetical protein